MRTEILAELHLSVARTAVVMFVEGLVEAQEAL